MLDQRNPAPRARRSPLMIALGVVLVVSGALASVGVYTKVARAQDVVAVVGTVARGERIERADLTTVHIGLDPLLTPVPAANLETVVGQYALSDLVPGTILTPGAVGALLQPTAGRAEVGVALMPGDYPVGTLRVGDAVVLVGLADPGADVTTPPAYDGILVRVGAPDANQMVVVTVDVAAAEAPTVAALAAGKHLALVLAARGPS